MIYYFTGTGNSQAAAGFFSRMLGRGCAEHGGCDEDEGV